MTRLSTGRAGHLYRPLPVLVSTGPGGTPVEVDGGEVVTVREEWVVEDRWWTNLPVRRWYFELILIDGRDLTVFRALPSGDWFTQRA